MENIKWKKPLIISSGTYIFGNLVSKLSLKGAFVVFISFAALHNFKKIAETLEGTSGDNPLKIPPSKKFTKAPPIKPK